MMVLLQEEITKEKFEAIKPKLEAFYQKSAEANKKVAKELS